MNETAPTAPVSLADRWGWSYFTRRVLLLTGMDLSGYKEHQLRRRLSGLMSRFKIHSWMDLAALLVQNQEAMDYFLKVVTINVSEFFRQPERFWDLRDRLLPELMHTRRQLNVWSAGCSYGAEPYSLAILLAEMTPLRKHKILATDVDQSALEQAKAGDCYTETDLKNVPRAWVDKYFKPAGSLFRVADRLKAMIEFRVHDLLQNPYPENMDLILCRNVAIYFTDAAKTRLYASLAGALRPGGILFVGGTELVPHSPHLGLTNRSMSFYQKAAA